jgi:hypothetical protein
VSLLAEDVREYLSRPEDADALNPVDRLLVACDLLAKHIPPRVPYVPEWRPGIVAALDDGGGWVQSYLTSDDRVVLTTFRIDGVRVAEHDATDPQAPRLSDCTLLYLDGQPAPTDCGHADLAARADYWREASELAAPADQDPRSPRTELAEARQDNVRLRIRASYLEGQLSRLEAECRRLRSG